jgi:hypothetical protein
LSIPGSQIFFEEDTIRKTIQRLPNGIAAGEDTMFNEMLKVGNHILSPI